jgi:hypothetical protein
MSQIKLTKAMKVRKYAATHPTATPAQIAKATKVQLSYVYNIVRHDRARMVKHKDLAPAVKKHIDEMKLVHTSTSDKSIGDIAYRAGQGRVVEVPLPLLKTWFQRLKSAIFP